MMLNDHININDINIINTENNENEKEPLSLLTLPNGIISLIFIEFLVLQDISRLDVSYCNHNNRKKFLSIICDDIKYDNINFDYEYIDNALIWFGKRKIIIPYNLSIKWSRSITLDGIIGISNNNFNNLTSISFRGCKYINDDCIILITRNSPKLQVLDISFCDGITNRGIEEIARNVNLQLQSLDIEIFDYKDIPKEISDEGIIWLAKYCHNLQSLNVSGHENITDIGISELVHSCTKIHTLNISGCTKIKSTGVIEIANHLPNLQAINIFGCSLIGNQGIVE